MSKSGAASSLVPRADIVSDIDGNDGRVVIFDRNHPQAVRQAGLFQINMNAAAGLRQCGTGQGEENRRHQKLFVQSHRIKLLVRSSSRTADCLVYDEGAKQSAVLL